MAIASGTDPVLAAIEHYLSAEATDGLPIVPPTRSAVEAMIGRSGMPSDTLLGRMPPRLVPVTVRDVAVNAVMAGCRPDYMPVLIAAAKGLCTDSFDTFGVACSTKGAAPLVIVNGPVRNQIGINCRGSVFGPGFRANATIGRAVRLMLLNLGQARPHILDKGTLGHSGRFSFCIGEDEEDSAWTPLHVERAGLRTDQSAVTLWGGEAPRQVSINDESGEKILLGVAFTLAMIALGDGTQGSSRPDQNGTRAESPHVVVFAKEHREILNREGWTKVSIREFIAENTEVAPDYLRRLGRDTSVPRRAVRSPDSLLVVAAGGNAGRFASVLPGWTHQSQPVTVAIN